MNKYIISLLIFLIAAVLLFITILITFEEPNYLTEEQVKSELAIE